MGGREAQDIGEDGRHARKVELDAEGRQLIAHPGEGDVGHLLVVPAAAHVRVRSREPDLLEICPAPRQPLPEGGAKGVAGLVQTQRLEGILDVVRYLRVGEAPLVRRAADADDGSRRDAQRADRVPDGDGLDSDGGDAVGVGVSGIFELSNLAKVCTG